MATITWKGGDDPAQEQLTWKGVVLPKGKAVEVEDEWMLRKASVNPIFEVSGYTPDPKLGAPGDGETVPVPVAYRAPSQMSAQMPAAKPGEYAGTVELPVVEVPVGPPPQNGGLKHAEKAQPKAEPPKDVRTQGNVSVDMHKGDTTRRPTSTGGPLRK